MEELVIDFKPNGQVTSLHMDGFDLGFLGKKETFRQTDIVFDSDTQLWNMEYLMNGSPTSRFFSSALEGFLTYEEARRVEVAWLNNCRLLGIEPASGQGMRIMAGLRKYG